MKILNPHEKISGEEYTYIVKDHIFVRVTDYNQKKILKKFVLQNSVPTWYWESIKKDSVTIEMKDVCSKISSFDDAINRAINDMYSTVYEFENIDEMIKNWNNIVYVDNIAVKYRGK